MTDESVWRSSLYVSIWIELWMANLWNAMTDKSVRRSSLYVLTCIELWTADLKAVFLTKPCGYRAYVLTLIQLRMADLWDTATNDSVSGDLACMW